MTFTKSNKGYFMHSKTFTLKTGCLESGHYERKGMMYFLIY